jgi:hypothetical protein
MTPYLEPPTSDGVFLTWEVLGSAMTVFGASFAALAGFVWKIGNTVGGYKREFDLLKGDVVDRRNKLEEKIDSLEHSDRSLERAVAALPDLIMTRINGSFQESFRDMSRRIDELIARTRPS